MFKVFVGATFPACEPGREGVQVLCLGHLVSSNDILNKLEGSVYFDVGSEVEVRLHGLETAHTWVLQHGGIKKILLARAAEPDYVREWKTPFSISHAHRFVVEAGIPFRTYLFEVLDAL